jgi:hypothetical protein
MAGKEPHVIICGGMIFMKIEGLDGEDVIELNEVARVFAVVDIEDVVVTFLLIMLVARVLLRGENIYPQNLI